MQKVGVRRAFVVHAQNSAGGFFFRVLALVIDVKNIHAIVVVADAARPIIGLTPAVGIGRRAGVHGVASGVQNAVLVAGRQDHVVQQALGHRRKSQGRGGRAHPGPQSGAAWQNTQARQTQATQQHASPLGIGQRGRQNILEVGRGAGVENGVDVWV